MKPNSTDIDVREAARLLSYLVSFPPVTRELDKWGSPYASQRLHMAEWLRWQTQVYHGAYGRSKANYSTMVTYNRFQNPGGLLWMAEALGEDRDTLRRAVKAAIEAEKVARKGDGKSRCAAFRRVIPWARIVELLHNPSGWLFDPSIKPYVEFDRDGYPIVRQGRRRRCADALTEAEEAPRKRHDYSEEESRKCRYKK